MLSSVLLIVAMIVGNQIVTKKVQLPHQSLKAKVDTNVEDKPLQQER